MRLPLTIIFSIAVFSFTACAEAERSASRAFSNANSAVNSTFGGGKAWGHGGNKENGSNEDREEE